MLNTVLLLIAQYDNYSPNHSKMSGLENSYNAVQLKMSTALSIPHAFMPRKFIDVKGSEAQRQ